MVRHIPGKTRIKTEFARNITLGDVFLGIICLAFAIVIISSNLFKIAGGDYRWYALLGWISIVVSLYIPIDEGLRLYSSVVLIIRFAAFPKKYIGGNVKMKGFLSMSKLTPFFNIEMGKYVNFGDYFGMVLEIYPVALDLMQEDAQDQVINTLSKALKLISINQRASIIKTTKPMRYDKYLKSDDAKFDLLNLLYHEGQYTSAEMDARSLIFRERVG